MSEVASQAVRTITSEVHVVSYVDDTILTGPAEDIMMVLQKLPESISPTGLELQPTKRRYGHHTPSVFAMRRFSENCARK